MAKKPQKKSSSRGQSSADEFKIGARLKELRFRNSWTLEDVGRKTGIAPSVLSKLENDQGAINIVTLQKLCGGLGISIDRLIRPGSPQAAGVRAINKQQQGTVLKGDRVTFQLMSEDLAQKEMFPVLITTEKTPDNPGDEWISFAGERFLFVVSGSIQLLTEFYSPLVLNQGESTQFDASMRHGVISASQDAATFLSVSYDATGRSEAAPFLNDLVKQHVTG